MDQGKYKVSLQHLLMPKSKEMLKKNSGMPNGKEANLMKLPVAKAGMTSATK